MNLLVAPTTTFVKNYLSSISRQCPNPVAPSIGYINAMNALMEITGQFTRILIPNLTSLGDFDKLRAFCDLASSKQIPQYLLPSSLFWGDSYRVDELSRIPGLLKLPETKEWSAISNIFRPEEKIDPKWHTEGRWR
jgi:hypothetical protein